jgi:transcriptional regulator of arginine metabolism
MQKHERQSALIEIIESSMAASQGELAMLLGKSGFSVTQASVSRDLAELGAVKTGGRYSLPPKGAAPASDLGSVTLDTAGENLIVGRCASGLASAITVRIDAANFDEIVGTIAGDDTIFIAVRNAGDQGRVIETIGRMFK